MSNEINVRLGGIDDLATIVSFNQAMARETEAKELDLNVLQAGVENLIRNRQHGFYIVAEIMGLTHFVVAGSLMVTYEWSDWRNGIFWWVQSVYIKPEYRRLGIYRCLYEFVKETAASETGVCGFRLYVEKDNRVAQHTYEQLGMHETQYLMYEEEYGNHNRAGVQETL